LTKEAASATPIAGRCMKPQGKCVPLFTDECASVTGDPLDEDAILLGSLLTEEFRHTEAAILAVEEIDSAVGGGGVPRAGNQGKPRPLAMLSCIESAGDPMPAARHLIERLRVPAVVGPDIDENALDIVGELIENGAGAGNTGNTALMSPTSLIDSLGSLPDNGLMWRDVPSGLELSRLVFIAYSELEMTLRATKPDLKLGIVYRDDAFGQNAIHQISNRAQFKGKPLSDPTNAAFVRISKYPRGDEAAVSALSAQYQTDPPDMMLLLGGVESISAFMKPLELALASRAGAGLATGKPTYLLFESNKVTELLELVDPKKTPGVPPDLRSRLRGVGVAPMASSQPAYDTFRLAFANRFGHGADGSGMGPAYDAVYAFAAALAATASQPPSGASVAAGLTAMSTAAPDAATLRVGRLDARQILSSLSTGPMPNVLGTFDELKWLPNGDYVGGRVEIWCVSSSNGSPYFGSGSVSMDLRTRMVTGAWTPCG
jgi:ABC-type branched-subunit amino acid transport system substrate-binding protein